MKTKILDVWGDDYVGALEFENSTLFERKLEICERCYKGENKEIILPYKTHKDAINLYFKSHLFESVDPEFIIYTKNLLDFYANSEKSFYLVEE